MSKSAPATTPAAPPPPPTAQQRKAVAFKLEQAYVSLICNQPFIATILLRLIRVEDNTAPTMWTDGRRLGYNVDFVEKLTRDELQGVLAHEVYHVAGLHPWRRGPRHPFAWNIACDKVVNSIVKESNFTLPANCIPAVPGKSAEELYEPPTVIEIGMGNAGAGDPGGCGEVRDPTNDQGNALSPAELEQAINEAKVLVQQAANVAKKAGKFPAGLNRFVDEALETKVPWREILARFMDGNARNDYSFSRPNRRYMESGILFPSLWSPGYGEVVFGCDTSGSVDQNMLREICGEVLGCMDMYAERGQTPELTVAWFDHAVYSQTVSDIADFNPQGGGGTSFRVVMEWLAESEKQPRALIMMTDGYCSDFGEPPACPVLWVLTIQNRDFAPPFGEIACVLNE
jgi:predicted metal-dependent peptidase